MAEMKFYAPDLISVCVRERREQDYAGELWHQYSKESIPFEGIAEMIRKMEDLYDRWDFPQKSTHARQFGTAPEAPARRVKPELGERDMDTLWTRRGDLGTFVVYVKYRQNSSWQGQVIWVEKQERMEFSSELELMKIMDEKLAVTG